MNPLAYPAYQAFANFMLPLRHGASLVQGALDAWPEYAATPSGRTLRASAELLTLAGLVLMGFGLFAPHALHALHVV